MMETTDKFGFKAAPIRQTERKAHKQELYADWVEANGLPTKQHLKAAIISKFGNIKSFIEAHPQYKRQVLQDLFAGLKVYATDHVKQLYALLR